MTLYWAALCIGVGTVVGYVGGQVFLSWQERREDED